VNILNNPQILNDGGFEPGTAAALSAGGAGILPEGLLDVIVRQAAAAAGVVRAFTSDRRMLQIISSVGLTAEVCERERLVGSGCGVCGEAVVVQGMRIADASACSRQSGQPLFGAAFKQVVAMPLEHGGSLTGLLTLFYADEHDVPPDFARAVRPSTEMLAIALDNGRRQENNLRASLMAERHAMANEIHDTLAHTLYFARMRMHLLFDAIRTRNEDLVRKCAEDVDGALDSGQKAAREIITHFRCQMDPGGLQHALRALAEEFAGQSGIALTYTNRAADFRLPLEHELQVFRIVREALANVAAHSRASQATLTADGADGRFVFTVEDNGCGCGGPSSEGHYGLMIMRERALRIGGEISVESTQGCGTRVKLSFPEP
jgi:two-component system nitrate/nitrite sensor histidine kinase NarX